MYIGGVRQKRVAILVFLGPALLGLFVFALLPILASVFLSLTNYDPLRPLRDLQVVGVANYLEYWSNKDLLAQYSHVLYYLVLYIPLVLLLSVGQALMLERAFRGKTLFKVIFYLPVITSWVAVALIWKWILNGEFGLLNNLLALTGIHGPAWLQNSTWAMPGIVLAAAWKDTGYYALIVLAALKSVDKSNYESARLDGANAWVEFTKITVPLISPTIFLLVVVNVIAGFQVFESIFIMTAGGPAGATRVPVEQVYMNSFTFYKMGYASAVALVLTAVILVATQVQLALEKKWVNYDN